MPKTKKLHSSKKIAKRNPSSKLKLFALCLVGAVLLAGGLLYKSLLHKSDINLIVDSGTYPRPIPSSTPLPQCAVVSAFHLSENCGTDSFRSVTFTCAQSQKNQRSNPHGNSKTCKTVTAWYGEAQASCLASCPSPTPTPTPKTTPKASVMCGQEYGSCIGKTKTCITYTDSCQKAQNCAVPFQVCGKSTPTPTSTPKSTPSYTAVPYPTSGTY